MQQEGIPTFFINTTTRQRGMVIHNTLTSPWLVSICILSLLAAIGLWTAVALAADPQQNIAALALLCSSIAGGLLLAFVYGVTSYPYARPPHTTTELLSSATGTVNVADAFDYWTMRVVGPHFKSGHESALPDVMAVLMKQHAVKDMMQRFELDEQDVTEAIAANVFPHLTMQQLAHTVVSQTAARNREHIHAIDIFGVFLLHPNLHVFIRSQGLQEQDISFGIWWQHVMRDGRLQKHRWWDPDNLLSFTGVGMSWASGYTPFVDSFIRIPRGNVWDIPYGRGEQVDQLTNTLARSRQSNVLLVGQPGVGRLGVVKEMARRVQAGKAHPVLQGQRVAYIHIGQLVALGTSGAEQLSVISRALDEMEGAGNIIAVLDGLGSVLGEAGEERVNVTDILMPFFSSSTIRVVVIMSNDEYHLRIKTNQSLLHFFEVVHVPPLSSAMTLELLALTAPEWERELRVVVSYKTLREIVNNTASILPYIPFPEKAFDILEEAIVEAQGQNRKTIAPEDINRLISHKIGIDVGRIQASEQQYLLDLENIIHKRVVNQKRGVAAVARAMVRARAGVRNQNRPIGTFLFLGPTGVEKTETAKALAGAYFGSEAYMQRLDMTEFQGEDGVARLIGSAQQNTGRLTSLIGDHPFCVLLLDEFEKADRLVKQLFLPVFDEGYIRDARGQLHSFNHTIIIATSNAGAEFIRSSITAEGDLPDDFDEKLRDHVLEQDVFRPEELNRFDGVITFTPLTQDHIKEVAELMLRKLNKRLDAEHGITVMITDELLTFLVEVGYDPQFGARPMARAIQDTVEYAVAEHIVRGAAVPGQQITLHPPQLEQLKQTAR
jgi:ATP-dependent Clp protease ATP-binding subunit ClpC